jgi:hypothetical protein
MCGAGSRARTVARSTRARRWWRRRRRTSARPVLGRNMFGAGPAPGPRTAVERLVGRQPSLPHTGLRAHSPSPRAAGDGGRHHLLRHRRHRVRPRAGQAGRRRPDVLLGGAPASSSSTSPPDWSTSSSCTSCRSCSVTASGCSRTSATSRSSRCALSRRPRHPHQVPRRQGPLRRPIETSFITKGFGRFSDLLTTHHQEPPLIWGRRACLGSGYFRTR